MDQRSVDICRQNCDSIRIEDWISQPHSWRTPGNHEVLCFILNIIFTQPLHSGRTWHKVNLFKQSLTGLNLEFSFSSTSCLSKAEEPSLSYYLPIAGGRIIGFIPFPRVLVLCEMQSVSSKIWTRVAVSISYNNNHYTTGTSFILYTIASLLLGYGRFLVWLVLRHIKHCRLFNF